MHSSRATHWLLLLSALSAALYAAMLALFAIALRRARRAPTRPLPSPAPSVSILKPCAGTDEALREALESFATLDYPSYELLCGVRDADDAAYPVLIAFRDAHPERSIRVELTGNGRSANPKIAQLEVLARRATGRLLWVSDSNTAVERDTLTTLVADLYSRPGTAIVVSPVVARTECTLGAAIANLHLAAFVTVCTLAVYALTGRVVGPGKSALVRRSALDSIGGFEALGRFCAEDYALVERLVERGHRVALGRALVTDTSRSGTVAQFVARQQRWTQFHWVTEPLAALGEPLLAPAAIALGVAAVAPSRASACSLCAAVVLQCAGDLAALRALRGRALEARYVVGAVMRPALFVWLWARAAVTRKVVWRGNVRWIGPGSAILDEPPLRAWLRGLAAARRQ